MNTSLRPLLIGAALWLCASLLSGCIEPPVPQPVPRATVGWSGNDNDAGLIAIDAQQGALVRFSLIERYNALIDCYGGAKEFLPPLKSYAGVHPAPHGLWRIDLQHWSYFLRMNRWHRQGRAPEPKPLIQQVERALLGK